MDIMQFNLSKVFTATRPFELDCSILVITKPAIVSSTYFLTDKLSFNTC